ncbi:MAG: hypothetical protein ACXVEC_08190 [Nocardioides sp.]
MRRIFTILAAAAVVVLALAAVVVAGGNDSTITKSRLERSLPATFSHLYVQQSQIEGRTGVTVANLHAKAMCDKGGASVADHGPGSDWNCLVSWTDPQVPMPPEGYGKFELNVHSNDCYTASGPSKLTGFLTINDKSGRAVTNPLFEFDGCFDPHGDNSPTGNKFPSVFSIVSTQLTPDSQGRVGIQVTCGTGADGCAGSVQASAGGKPLGTITYDLQEEKAATLMLPTPLPAGTTEVDFTPVPATGYASTKPVTIPVQSGS